MVPSKVYPRNVHITPDDAMRSARDTLRRGARYYVYEIAPGEYEWSAIPWERWADEWKKESPFEHEPPLILEGEVLHPWGSAGSSIHGTATR